MHRLAVPLPEPPPSHRVNRVLAVWLGRRPAGAASAIYGTILVTAIIVALSEDKAAGAAELAEATAASALVFWLDHAYAEVLGERASAGRRPRRNLTTVLVDEWPIAESAILPVAALLAATAGLISTNAAVRTALGIALVELIVWGYVAGWRSDGSVGRALLVGLFNALLGGVLIALKALVK